MVKERITYGNWLEQELQLGGTRHAMRAKAASNIFPIVWVQIAIVHRYSKMTKTQVDGAKATT